MELKLYDTLAREKRVFVPLDRDRVRMYVCGPTVYDFAHIGNARPVIVFDVLFRLLRHLYGPEHVVYVRNITDVDDKINARAAEEYPNLPLNEAIRKVTETTERQFHEDVAALGCLAPTYEPRATEYVRRTDGRLDMITLIQRLIDNGCAYVAEGHVLFDVKSMPDYGRLARRTLDEMIAGARVEVAPYKRDPMDFVLWKPSKEGEPAWDSPWSKGRPGWHIECSAMSAALLGETFDIHGGGIDLVFPHHENEIAQSRCAFHTKAMANFWMHNGFLQVEGRKMAKSEGNFITIRDLLETDRFGGRSWPRDVLRFTMLKTHYRQPIDWTHDDCKASYRELREWSVHVVSIFEKNGFVDRSSNEFDRTALGKLAPSGPILNALLDDLNTSKVVTALRSLRPSLSSGDVTRAKEMYANLEFLGLTSPRNLVIMSNGINADLATAQQYERELSELRTAELNNLADKSGKIRQSLIARGAQVESIGDGCWSIKASNADEKRIEIEALIASRDSARKAKNFAEADRIRDELAAMGVVLHDTKDGTTWEIAR